MLQETLPTKLNSGPDLAYWLLFDEPCPELGLDRLGKKN